jgi:hypothetical protein
LPASFVADGDKVFLSKRTARREGHERFNGSPPAVALGGGPVIFTQANSSITPRRGFIRDNSVLGRK